MLLLAPDSLLYVVIIIYCFSLILVDDTRVVLNTKADYINANYIAVS